MKKQKLLIIAISVIAIAFTSCFAADLSTDKAKYSYSIGQQIGNKIRQQKIDLDTKAFKQGVEDALKKESKLSDQEQKDAFMKMSMMQQKSDSMSAQKVKSEGQIFLETNKTKPGIKVTVSGLQYKVIKKGTGKSPKATDKVRVHYKGVLVNGQEFDSSYKRNQPAEFPLNRVIKGWTEGLQLMKKGAKFQFFIPSDLGYGDRSSGSIPGGSVLIFDVELLKIL